MNECVVGFEESIFWQVCYNCSEFHELWWVLNMAHYNCGEFHELWWVLNMAHYNCGDFHELWWVLNNWHIIIVVIFMNCGGF